MQEGRKHGGNEMTEHEKDLFIEQLQNELHNSKETVNAQKVVIRQLCSENAKLETEIRKLKQGAENEDAGGTHDEGREGYCKQSNDGGGVAK
jgi:DNA anti-recombination protein RmuC